MKIQNLKTPYSKTDSKIAKEVFLICFILFDSDIKSTSDYGQTAKVC